MNKTFICLASSRKYSGLCMAGKELYNDSVGNWVRPVSERISHEISHNDCQYKDGSPAQVFDIINVEFKIKDQHPAQSENYIIDDGYYWSKQGRYEGSLDDLLDEPKCLWSNYSSSYNGRNDRVSESSISSPVQSLYFICPENLNFIVQTEGAQYGNGKKKVRAKFKYKGVWYKIVVTDPKVERKYLAKNEGVYTPKGKIYMTVSLGEVYEGYYYKLAAGIYEDDTRKNFEDIIARYI